MKKYFRGKKGENVNFFIFTINSRFEWWKKSCQKWPHFTTLCSSCTKL